MDTCICGSEKVVLILFLYFFFNTSGWQMSNSHMRWKIIYFSKYDFSFHFEKSFWLLFILPNSDSTTHIIIIIIINKDDLSIRSRTRNNRSKLICNSADHPNLVTNIICLISYKPLPIGSRPSYIYIEYASYMGLLKNVHRFQKQAVFILLNNQIKIYALPSFPKILLVTGTRIHQLINDENPSKALKIWMKT